jgi:transposase
VKDVYSEVGSPSIDPVILIKLIFIQYTFGIRSMRQTIAEVETNMVYRWFLGYGFNDKVPHFSTFGKNYERRFKDTDLFEQIFYRISRRQLIRNLLVPNTSLLIKPM